MRALPEDPDRIDAAIDAGAGRAPRDPPAGACLCPHCGGDIEAIVVGAAARGADRALAAVEAGLDLQLDALGLERRRT